MIKTRVSDSMSTRDAIYVGISVLYFRFYADRSNQEKNAEFRVKRIQPKYQLQELHFI